MYEIQEKSRKNNTKLNSVDYKIRGEPNHINKLDPIGSSNIESITMSPK